MNGRRSFVKGVGLFSALFAGGAVARAQAATPALGSPNVSGNHSSAISEAVDPAIIKQLEEQATNNLTLSQTYGDVVPPEPVISSIDVTNCGSGYSSTFKMAGSTVSPSTLMTVSNEGGVCIGGSRLKTFVPGSENQVNVKMVAGPDGELYLNIKGQWKKVLTV